MKRFEVFGLVALLACLLTTSVNADQLVLSVRDRVSAYQIIVPDASGDALLDAVLHETARLMQAAFQASGVELAIVAESSRDSQKSGIYLGNTNFAQRNGVDVTTLDGWSYVQKVVGQDLIVTGHDQAPPKIKVKNLGSTAWFSYRLGTLKATTDFLRQYTQTYFLFPGSQDIPTQRDRTLRPWRLDAVDIEFGSRKIISVPNDLDLHKHVFMRYHTRKRTAVLYDVANNFFPKVDDAALLHTWNRAISADEYRDEHPEYFALRDGKRTREEQYCLSNPQVRELIYQFTKSLLDQGCRSVNIFEPDGFRACQCQDCFDLYGVGDDWGEKIWIFHRSVAERLLKECPGKQLMIASYTLTSRPPKTFKTFPENVIIQTVDAISKPTESFLAWSERHQGEFSCNLHNWITIATTRYTPARTPLFVSDQAKLFYKYNYRGIYRDGLGESFGLEGPTYYIFGRTFDDAENLEPKDLMYEYCSAAFGPAAGHARMFYDRMNRAIEVYSQYLGTHGVAWSGKTIYGSGGQYLGKDPFQVLSFLYTPGVIKDMERNLTLAEKAGQKIPRVMERLTLVRREFDYLKDMIKVIHLHQAYEMAPSIALRAQLLDAIDDRNARIHSYYQDDKGTRVKAMAGWSDVLFPPSGHSFLHLRLNYNYYQNPFADSAFNWDTAAVRKSPLPDAKRLVAIPSLGKMAIGDARWERVPSTTLKDKTTFRVTFDDKNLYVKFQTSISESLEVKPLGNDAELDRNESFDIYIAPKPGQDYFYHFAVGPDVQTRFDSASGLVTDILSLLYDKDDASWNGSWNYESQVNRDNGQWQGLLTIPLKTMNVKTPATGESWRMNAGRVRVDPSGSIERVAWSEAGGVPNACDRNALASLAFAEAGDDKDVSDKAAGVREWRENHYKETFKVPAEWAASSTLINDAFSQWMFRPDLIERGVKEHWFAVDAGDDQDAWKPIDVSMFWDESEVGPFNGHGWYRTTLRIPEDAQGKSFQLMFAGVDEQAWIYLNGQLIGEHTTASTTLAYGVLWDRPFTIDVDKTMLAADGHNVLVVRVHNQKNAGGIWRPVLLQMIE